VHICKEGIKGKLENKRGEERQNYFHPKRLTMRTISMHKFKGKEEGGPRSARY
jgi:hypothetical protein